MEERRRDNDHELLIRVDERIQQLSLDVKDLKDNTIKRLADLENEKVNIASLDKIQKNNDKIHNDYEKRLRRLEYWGAIACGGLTVLQIFVGYFLKYK